MLYKARAGAPFLMDEGMTDGESEAGERNEKM
jgi:hypothetical protein